MRTRLLNLLLLTALALAAVRFQAFLREPPRRSPPVEPAVSEPVAEQPPPAETAAAVAERAQSYDIIVARDLFSQERGVVPPSQPPPGQPAAKSQPPPKLTLYGVVILDNEKFAYLHEGAQEAKPRKVREGDRFAGGSVVAIREDAVTFLFGGSEIAVPLRTPKEGIAAAPPAQPQRQGAAEGGVTPPGSTVVPRRVPQATRYQGPGSPPTPQPSPTPAARRNWAPGVAPEDMAIDNGNLPEEPTDDGDQQYFGGEDAEE